MDTAGPEMEAPQLQPVDGALTGALAPHPHPLPTDPFMVVPTVEQPLEPPTLAHGLNV